VNIPRPRTLGRNEHQAEVARCSAELHELLMSRAGEDGSEIFAPDVTRPA
jgi:NitT/TauT family transport system ATP-binding protein